MARLQIRDLADPLHQQIQLATLMRRLCFRTCAQERALEAQESQEAWQRFGVLRSHRLQNVPMAAEDFDALHLALCQRLNQQRASFDRGLCKAAVYHQVAHQQLLT